MITLFCVSGISGKNTSHLKISKSRRLFRWRMARPGVFLLLRREESIYLIWRIPLYHLPSWGRILEYPTSGAPASQTTSILLSVIVTSLNPSYPFPSEIVELLRPNSAFFRIMTSKIRGVREMRYNRVRSRFRCTRISPGSFDSKNSHG